MQHVDPSHIMQIGTGFWASKTLLSAVELELFTVLGTTWMTAEENMLIEFGEAFDFTGADFRGWCEEAGFQRFEVMELTGPSSAAIAYK